MKKVFKYGGYVGIGILLYSIGGFIGRFYCGV